MHLNDTPVHSTTPRRTQKDPLSPLPTPIPHPSPQTCISSSPTTITPLHYTFLHLPQASLLRQSSHPRHNHRYYLSPLTSVGMGHRASPAPTLMCPTKDVPPAPLPLMSRGNMTFTPPRSHPVTPNLPPTQLPPSSSHPHHTQLNRGAKGRTASIMRQSIQGNASVNNR